MQRAAWHAVHLPSSSCGEVGRERRIHLSRVQLLHGSARKHPGTGSAAGRKVLQAMATTTSAGWLAGCMHACMG